MTTCLTQKVLHSALTRESPCHAACAAADLFARLDALKPAKVLMAQGKWLTEERCPVLPAPLEERRNLTPYYRGGMGA